MSRGELCRSQSWVAMTTGHPFSFFLPPNKNPHSNIPPSTVDTSLQHTALQETTHITTDSNFIPSPVTPAVGDGRKLCLRIPFYKGRDPPSDLKLGNQAFCSKGCTLYIASGPKVQGRKGVKERQIQWPEVSQLTEFYI